VRDEEFSEGILGAFFCRPVDGKKPGFPLQFLSLPAARLAGFPLQSRLHGRATILLCKIVTSQDAWASNNFAK
jgi:hypothetical protein